MEFNNRILSPKTVLKSEHDYVVFQKELRDYARAAGVAGIWNGTRVRVGNDEQIAAFDSDSWKLMNVMNSMLHRDVKLAMHGAIGDDPSILEAKAWLALEYGNDMPTEHYVRGCMKLMISQT